LRSANRRDRSKEEKPTASGVAEPTPESTRSSLKRRSERRLAEIFQHANIRRIELKSESHQWEKTGNICIEYRQNGNPSGIAATEADLWVHELKRDGETLCYLMFPAERLKKLARRPTRKGDIVQTPVTVAGLMLFFFVFGTSSNEERRRSRHASKPPIALLDRLARLVAGGGSAIAGAEILACIAQRHLPSSPPPVSR
jgi:hypothetical protein